MDLSKISFFTHNYNGPFYFYDLAEIRHRAQSMKRSLDPVRIFYAMKANSHLQILKTLRHEGLGVDVVSGGEIRRAFEAGFSPQEIIFSGIGKTTTELELAIERQIYQINVESIPELIRIIEIANAKKKQTSIAIRLNPNIDIQTHPYIATGLHENKFGIELSALNEVTELLRNESWVLLKGISLHLGSQMMEFGGFRQALQLLRETYNKLQKEYASLDRFDVGGGLGISYEEDGTKSDFDFLANYTQILKSELSDMKAEIQTEPGRWLVARSGVLVSQVQYVKTTPYRTFLILDTGMNHLIRPALYGAFHRIETLRARTKELVQYDIVGPICESADFFAKERKLPVQQQGDFILIRDTGAYGFSMANQYNLQELPREICVDSV